MKLAHNVKLTVHAHGHEKPAPIADKLIGLVPFDLDDEKLELKQTIANSFEDKKIIIFEIYLEKQSHVSKFLKHLLSRLSQEQKDLLKEQAESRLDPELNFFIRLDKEKLLQEDIYQLTDSGNCYHIRIQIAAFPAKRDKGLETVHSLLER